MDSPNYLIGETIRGYTIIELLGKGGFAYVYRARRSTGQDVALKVINKGLIKNEELKRRVEKEAEIHSSLNHESIIKLYEFFKEDTRVFLVLELCEKGTLTQCMDERGYPFSESEARDMLKQVVGGVMYLHSQNIMHRDLSPRNLLLTSNGRVKIADFGLAADTEDKHKTLCGTPNFMSPEVATRSLYGPEVDVWSLGCLLYHLLVGKPPFDANGVKRTLTNVVRDECKIPPSLSAEATELIQLMLKKDAKRRIKLKDIKNHRFLNVSFYSSKSVSKGGSSVESGLGSSFASSNSGRRNHSNRVTSDCILELDTIQSTGLSDYCGSVSTHPRYQRNYNSQNCFKSPPIRHKSWENVTTSQNPIGLLKSKLPTLPSFGVQLSGPRTRLRSPVPCEPAGRGRERDVSEERKKQQVINAERTTHYEEDMKSFGCLFGKNMDGKTSSDCCLAGHSNSCSSCSHHQLCCSNSMQCSHAEICCCRKTAKHLSLECMSHHEESGCCHHPTTSSHEIQNSSQHSGHQSLSSNGRRSPSPSGRRDPSPNGRRDPSPSGRRDPSPNGLRDPSPKSQRNRLSCLNTSGLRPTRQKTKNAVVSILENGEVCVEFFKQIKRVEKVVDVCLISKDGWRIVTYKPGRHGVPLKDKPPPLPKDGADDIFSFESLPEKYWKKYEYATRFVEVVRAKTPKLTYYSSQAKCLMMENFPDPDFEVSFYSGEKIAKSTLNSKNRPTKAAYKISDAAGVSTMVFDEEHVQKLRPHLWQHFLEVEELCKMLELVLSKTESSSGKSCFPAIIGRKPNSAVHGLSESNKENIISSTVRSPLDTPINHSMMSFNGTLSTEQYYSDGSSPNFDVLSSHKLLSKQNIRPNSLPVSRHRYTVDQENASQSLPRRTVLVAGVGMLTQTQNGVFLKYTKDNSELYVPSCSTDEVVFTNAHGEVMRYGQNSIIPKEVQEKLSQVPPIMQEMFEASFGARGRT